MWFASYSPAFEQKSMRYRAIQRLTRTNVSPMIANLQEFNVIAQGEANTGQLRKSNV